MRKLKEIFFPNYNNRLIRLMDYKQQIIYKCIDKYLKDSGKTPIDIPLYFTFKDLKYLCNIQKNVAKKIVKKMLYNLENHKNNVFSVFYSEFCPFCIWDDLLRYINMNTRCKLCSYGMKHGICDNDDSDYDKIWNFLNDHFDITKLADYKTVKNILKGRN